MPPPSTFIGQKNSAPHTFVCALLLPSQRSSSMPFLRSFSTFEPPESTVPSALCSLASIPGKHSHRLLGHYILDQVQMIEGLIEQPGEAWSPVNGPHRPAMGRNLAARGANLAAKRRSVRTLTLKQSVVLSLQCSLWRPTYSLNEWKKVDGMPPTTSSPVPQLDWPGPHYRQN